MAFAVPKLDHVVVDVRNRMDEAAHIYRSLGFQLTERGHHTLGSMNHLAVFDTDYVELLGFDEKAGTVRADILEFPAGLNGLVFTADQPDQLFQHLQSQDVPALEPSDFSRPVNLPEGSADVRFRVVRLRPGAVPYGRLYFCHHFTPHLVWRPEWRRHANGAASIARILIAVRDPAAAAEFFGRIFGPHAVGPRSGGTWTLSAGAARIELVPPGEIGRRLGDAAPDPAGRADYMAALSIRTSSLSQAAQALKAGGIHRLRIERGRILAAAAEAMNVALEFIE